MARFAFFADLPTGEVLEWNDTIEGGKLRAARGIDNQGGGKVRGFSEAHGWVKVTRQIEMKSAPTRHECDARCFNATGRIMRCECSCGGKNHGRGAFACVEA